MQPSVEPYHPFRRLTSTPKARLTEIAQLLSFISQFRCPEHRTQASVHGMVQGRISYGACCERLLDIVEQALRRDSSGGNSGRSLDRPLL